MFKKKLYINYTFLLSIHTMFYISQKLFLLSQKIQEVRCHFKTVQNIKFINVYHV